VKNVEPYFHKHRAIKWLMGETEPTRLEPILCVAGIVIIFGWFIWGVSA
jgi:hypothetical protein